MPKTKILFATFVALIASSTSWIAEAGLFTPKPKESYICRPDRRSGHIEVRINDIEIKNGPMKAKFELWNDGVRSQAEKGNALRTDLDQKKFIVVATQKSQVSFDVSNKPYRGTLSIAGQGEEKDEELEITCERSP